MNEGCKEREACPGSARFRVNLEELLEGHRVLHRAPATDWQDGLYLGNGDLAAMVFGTPQQTRILLNKGDLWDERSEELPRQEDYWSWIEVKNAIVQGLETGDWSAYREAVKPSGKEPHQGNFSSFQPAGYLEVRGDLPAETGSFSQQLSLYRAQVRTHFEHAGKAFGFQVYTHADHNLLVLDLGSEAPELWPRSLQLHRNLVPFRRDWPGDPAMGEPAFGAEGDTLWMTMIFPDGFSYAVVLQTPGFDLGIQQKEDSITGHLGEQAKVRCFLTILTAKKGNPAELVAQGREELHQLQREENLEETHRAWWADFWHQGWISLPDKLVENLWYTEIYKIASCSREGGQAPGQLGHWSPYPDPPWRGDYHTNINVQESYWPIYTANRLELGAPFYHLYLGMLDLVTEETRRRGLPGAQYPRGHGPSGRSNSPSSVNWGIWPGSGPWLCTHFWWHYQCTQDRDFLRECYPLFRACLDFFLAYLGEPDPTGQYSIVPSLCHEQAHDQATTPEGRTWGRNSPYDLALLREHLTHTLQASEILGGDEGERGKWRQVLENLAPYPVSEKGYLMEWEGIELTNSHRHLSHLYPIFPGEEIHQGSSPEWVEIGRRSVARMVERGFAGFCGFSFPWLAAAAARMGQGDIAWEMIHNHIRAFVNLNGFSMITDTKVPGLGDYARGRGPDWEGGKLLNMESGSGLGGAINELLLGSPRGRIRVFPALPEDWAEARFSRLRAQGAFLVTAERRAGRTGYVLLESEAGAECRLAHPWPGEAVVIRSSRGESGEHGMEGEEIVFPTETGATYLVFPAGYEPEGMERVHLPVQGEEPPRLGVGGPFSRGELPWIFENFNRKDAKHTKGKRETAR